MQSLGFYANSADKSEPYERLLPTQAHGCATRLIVSSTEWQGNYPKPIRKHKHGQYESDLNAIFIPVCAAPETMPRNNRNVRVRIASRSSYQTIPTSQDTVRFEKWHQNRTKPASGRPVLLVLFHLGWSISVQTGRIQAVGHDRVPVLVLEPVPGRQPEAWGSKVADSACCLRFQEPLPSQASESQPLGSTAEQWPQPVVERSATVLVSEPLPHAEPQAREPLPQEQYQRGLLVSRIVLRVRDRLRASAS